MTMTNMNKLLGIFLAITMVLGSVPLGFSEPLRVQLEQGIETNQIQCSNPNHTLVERTNGKLACATEKTSEKLGWEIITSTTKPVNLINGETTDTKLITKTLTQNENNISNIYLDGDAPTNFSIIYPDTITVDTPFEVKVEYDYIDENGTALENPVPQTINLFIDDRTELISITSDNAPVQNLDGTLEYDLRYIFGGYYGYYQYEMYHPNDGAKKQNLTFTFKTIEPTYGYPNNISLEMTGVRIPDLYLDYGDSRTTAIMSENIEKRDILPLEVRELPDSYSASLHNQFYPNTSHDWQNDTVMSDPVNYGVGVATMEQVEKYIPQEGWASLYEFLTTSNAWDSTAQNITEYFISENMSEQFINDFLATYPDLTTQSFLPFSNFILPSAFGAIYPDVFVYGTYKVQNEQSGSYTSPIGSKVCVYDYTPENFQDLHSLENYDVMYYGAISVSNEACKFITASTGFYSMTFNNIDSSRDGTTAEILPTLVTENNVVKLVDHSYWRWLALGNPVNNFSGTLLNYGDKQLSFENPFREAHQIYRLMNEGHQIVDDKTNKSISKVFAFWSGDRNLSRSCIGSTSGACYNPALERIYFSVSQGQDPLTITHEYGHHTLKKIYESNGGTYDANTNCGGHNIHLASSERCAWTEGWAGYFAISQIGVTEIGVDLVRNLESRSVTLNGVSQPSFNDGITTEGNVIAVLLDISDNNNEVVDSQRKDNISNDGDNIWTIIDGTPATSNTPTQSSILDFAEQWKNQGFANLNNILFLNTITNSLPDSTDPQVQITNPANRFTSGSTSITISGTSSDNVGVESVKIYVNDVLSGTLTSSLDNWSHAITLPRSTNTVKVIAEDAQQNTAEHSIFVFYDNGSGGGCAPNCVNPNGDDDGDGIANSVDTGVNTFSDGTTSGQITARGGQIFTIRDATGSSNGVTITTQSMPRTNEISSTALCNNKATLTMNNGDSVTATCGSVILDAHGKSLGVVYTADNGKTFSTRIGNGDKVTFDETVPTLSTTATSNTLNITIDGAGYPLSAGSTITLPSIVTDLDGQQSNDSVILSWSAPSDGGIPINDYLVQYKRSSDTNWITFNDGVSSTTGATVTGLEITSYDFKVAPKNPMGTAGYSNPISITLENLDIISPVITLDGVTPVQVTQNDSYVDAGAICIDETDGFLSVTVGGLPIDTTILGTYPVTYDCADTTGNDATQIVRTVNVVLPQIPPVSVGSKPMDIAINNLTNTLYTANSGSSTVSVINGTTNAVTNTITDGLGAKPFGVIVDESRNIIYTANFRSGNVSVIDGETNIVTDTISLGDRIRPVDIAVNESTNTIYVSNYYPPGITVIDGDTKTVILTISLSYPAFDIAVNETTNTLYIATNGRGSISVIDVTPGSPTENTVTHTFSSETFSAYGIAVNETTNKIYVSIGGTSLSSGHISVIDGDTNTITHTIPSVGNAPSGIAVNETTNTIYVANNNSANMSIIDGEANSITETIATGIAPTAIAVHEATGTIYVANLSSDTISVFLQ